MHHAFAEVEGALKQCAQIAPGLWRYLKLADRRLDVMFFEAIEPRPVFRRCEFAIDA